MPQIRSILIGLPTMGGSMKTGTTLSIVDTVRALEARGIRTIIHNVDSCEIVTARDILANMVLNSPDWDAILFIDSDMAFRPELVLKLLDSGAEVAAAACPRRSLDLHRFAEASREHGNFAKSLAQSSNFTVNFDWNPNANVNVEINDGFVKATGVGMAIALIAKTALQALVQAKIVDRRRDLNSDDGKPCYSFFEILAPKGSRLGEDYSFCYRWTARLKREIVVCVDEEVQHIGFFPYRARFADLSDG